jgi:hypothetical protein
MPSHLKAWGGCTYERLHTAVGSEKTTPRLLASRDAAPSAQTRALHLNTTTFLLSEVPVWLVSELLL